jgi:hypothetical protein
MICKSSVIGESGSARQGNELDFEILPGSLAHEQATCCGVYSCESTLLRQVPSAPGKRDVAMRTPGIF